MKVEVYPPPFGQRETKEIRALRTFCEWQGLSFVLHEQKQASNKTMFIEAFGKKFMGFAEFLREYQLQGYWRA